MFASKDTLLTRPSGYNIARSVRFRNSASAYFGRTPASNGNRQIFTWSGWVKRGTLGSRVALFNSGDTGSGVLNGLQLLFFGDNTITAQATGGTTINLVTSALYRDPSAWYHIVFAVDTTQATSSNRVKIYVNGSQITSFSTATYPSQNQNFDINNTLYPMKIGASVDTATTVYYYDGYMTEINYVDGQQLSPSSFGSTDAITGVWQPAKYTGTYGTNGFYLNFSSNGTSAALGTDFSGNSNTWTVNNISVTAGVTYDSMLDVPTLTSTNAANYCVMNPLNLPKGGTLSNGNLLWTSPTAEGQAVGTMYVSSGKFYWEMISNTSGGCAFGIASNTTDINNINLTAGSYVYYTNGNKYNGGTGSAYGATFTNGDLIGIALDLDAGTLVFYKNNTSQGTAFTGLSGTFTALIYEGTSASSLTFDANFGQRPFTYTPPTGYVALNTYNLPTSTITNGAAYMAATTWTGVNTSAAITISNAVNGVSFQPDLVWGKPRSLAYSHSLSDSVRGANKRLQSQSTAAEDTNLTYGYTSSFNSDGFTTSAGATDNENWNTTGATFVAWQWKAGTTSSSNTSGSITSTVSANTTAGFSIVLWTGNGVISATVGHGLNAVPAMIICKERTGTDYWHVKHQSTPSNTNLYLNTTLANTSAASVGDGVLADLSSSTTFGFATAGSPGNVNAVNENGILNVAYCFSAVAGYSAFGSYTGNGVTDGPFVYTGFRPRWIMIKSTGVEDWIVHDTSRNPYNASNLVIYPNSAQAEDNNPTYRLIDILSNGFKMRSSQGQENGSGITYVYAAFAENPFKNALAR